MPIELPALEAPQRDVEDEVEAQEQGESRQRHIQSLFPHILTHPPVTSHNRPRLKHHQGTLLNPGPPPTLPLPALEYHDAAKEIDKKGKGKRAEGTLAPAHEIRCIARVTVRVGPFSYPDTELWIGSFVDPATYVKPKIRPAPRPSIPKPPRAPVPVKTVVRPPVRPIARPPSLYRPPLHVAPGPPQPLPRPPAPPVRPPVPGASATPASAINPTLIAQVNEAAGRFPRLSVIIHSAAKGTASRDELAILGRVVAKIGKNEAIVAADIALPAAFGPRPSVMARPPTRPAAPSAAAPAPPPPAAPTAAARSESDLSDEEPDMTGPKQVGGGYVPDPPRSSQPLFTARPLPQISGPGPSRPPYTGLAPTAAVVPPLPPSGTPLPRPPIAHAPSAIPPVPVKEYHVPRFLLLAFKDSQTDKVMIPLGINSYMSRKGGNFVTGPPPEPPRSPTAKTRAATMPTPVQETPKDGAPAGTIFVSFFTCNEWQNMDWAGVAKTLPWRDPDANVNIGKTDLLSDGPIQAVTVKLEGLDDAAWKKMKDVMREVEVAEMKERQVDLAAYNELRRVRFESLLARVPARRFLQIKADPDSAVIEAMTDKWALRPYQMSNRAHVEEPEERIAPPPKKRKEVEPAVTFEMPVSFDALDERLEEGVFATGRRGRASGRGRGGGRRLDGQPKKHRGAGRTDVPCEGCGLEGLKVWRRGPGGATTLCNACGDMFVSGTLPPLKAPGAASKPRNEDKEEDLVKEEADGGIQADNVGFIQHESDQPSMPI